MSPAQILERSYETLKRRLIEGSFLAGQRLEAARLSEQLHASITPIRDVLNRLTGEGLVHAIAGDGFYVPLPDEGSLRDLLDWNAALALQAARAQKPVTSGFLAVRTPASDIAARTASLFTHLAGGLDNGEFVRAVANVNDRLHAMRLLDERVIGKTGEELDAFEAVVVTGDAPVIVKRVRQFHSRRRARLATYVRLLRAPPSQ